MLSVKYQIYQLSARSVLGYAREQDGAYTFTLDAAETKKCVPLTSEQDDNALFYQIMCVLHGDDFAVPKNQRVISDLAEVIFYMDFAGIFDHRTERKKYLTRQKKAETMFRPEGIVLDFGGGPHAYVAFERSGSMSRKAKLSFIRRDYYEPVRRRIMMDLKIDRCQLSKLYAYNGLMLSSGVRIDGIEIDRPHRVIVVDNPVFTESRLPVITVEGEESQGGVRRYHRVKKLMDVDTLQFDGEGLVSKEYAKVIDNAYCGRHPHHSFQIRLPYIKGMLHEVDFKDFLKSAGVDTITDIWGEVHQAADVDIILTKSQFKGYGWLTENRKFWADYWEAFRRYRHGLYITNVSKEKPSAFTELNYQFLATLSIQSEEFRPGNLPDGWTHSPAEDPRHWLTKETELAYYNLYANEKYRLEYFLDRDFARDSREYHLARVLKKNPLFLAEPYFTKQLEDRAEHILRQYAVGRLIVAGDNRFFSDDLLELLVSLLPDSIRRNNRQRTFYTSALLDQFKEPVFYAPKAAYAHSDSCTLLRNPHIARNEEVQMMAHKSKDNMRRFYFGHLSDVVMIPSHTMTAERLGGADFDGDMVKTIADPIVNRCVRRNYDSLPHDPLNSRRNLSLLKIPTETAQVRSADDWYAQFETVRDTFSSRIGQICNAALDRSTIAYNENSDAAERQRCREETELLAILTGLEIDSAKTGVRPDLEEYLGRRTVRRTSFLQYKNLLEKAEERRAWYEPTHAQKLKTFFEKTDWEQVDSCVERLPYLAHLLKKNTPKLRPKSAADEELFTFAQIKGWKERLDPAVLSSVKALLDDYEVCLARIRACCVPVTKMQRIKDIERILYSRGQEDEYGVDELYALFQRLPPERIANLRRILREQGWHFMDEDIREEFLRQWLPEMELAPWYELLCDFRFGGYRVLGDVVCDVDDENAASDHRKLFRESDTTNFTSMMIAYTQHPFARNHRETVAEKCRELLDGIVKPKFAVLYVVALGKRKLLWELLPDQIERHVVRVRHDQRMG